MNAAWHRRRAKREVRRGGPLGTMPHVLKLKFSTLNRLCYQLNRGVSFRLNDITFRLNDE